MKRGNRIEFFYYHHNDIDRRPVCFHSSRDNGWSTKYRDKWRTIYRLEYTYLDGQRWN